jgi:hypothetical protein
MQQSDVTVVTVVFVPGPLLCGAVCHHHITAQLSLGVCCSVLMHVLYARLCIKSVYQTVALCWAAAAFCCSRHAYQLQRLEPAATFCRCLSVVWTRYCLQAA